MLADDQRRRQPAGRQFLVRQHILPGVAEVFGGERLAVRPFVPVAKLEGEDTVLFDLEVLQHVGLEIELLVIADQPLVADQRHQADVALATDQHPHDAAILARLAAHGGDVNDARFVGQAQCEPRDLAGRDQRPEVGRVTIGRGARGKRQQRRAHQGQCGASRDHGLTL